MPRVLVFYHYFHPDDVVSAQHYADLCLGLREFGWNVTVMPCNRGCRDESLTYPLKETWQGITVRRVWRPAFRQGSTHGRILNAIWMTCAWSLASLAYRPDAIIIGTDPILCVCAAIPWKLLHPHCRILHWCFDLYPEAAIADGMLKEQTLCMKALKFVLGLAYRCCDAIGSLGVCMTKRLRQYGTKLSIEELTPWAL